MIQTGASTLRPLYDSSITSPVFDAELLGRRQAEVRGVVPGQLGDRLGQLLEPAVVANRPSQTVGSGRKTISRPPAGRRPPAAGPRSPLGSTADGRQLRPRDDPVVDRGLPEGLEVLALRASSRARSRGRSRGRSGSGAGAGRRPARSPTGRRRAGRSAAAGSSPCRRRPRTSPQVSSSCASGTCQPQSGRGLVVVQAQPGRELDLLQARRRTRVGRRGVGRVAAEDEQHVDLARVHGPAEVGQRLDLVDRLGLDRLAVLDRAASPSLPRAWLIAAARAWTSAGCPARPGPGPCPRAFLRSSARASRNRAVARPRLGPGAGGRRATPSRLRQARGEGRRRPAARSGSRWSAVAPVTVSVGSTT